MKGIRHHFVINIFLIYFFKFSNGECQNGVQTFILGSNINLNANPYIVTSELNIQNCLNNCRNQKICKSLIFHRRQSNVSCSLFNVTVYDIEYHEDPNSYGSIYIEKACLNISDGCERKTYAFELVVGGQLQDYTSINYENLSRSECLEKCIVENKIQCRSVTFDTQRKQCRLNRYDKYIRSTRFSLTNKTVLYYDNYCVVQPTYDGPTAEVILLGNAQHPYVLSEFEEKTVGECGQLCLRNIQFPCRSFLYGKKNGKNYCALSHQNRIGLMKDRNSFSSTQFLNYYEITQKLDVCDAGDIHFELTSGEHLDEEPYKVVTDTTQDNCLTLCRKDTKCQAFSVDHTHMKCNFHELPIRSATSGQLKVNPSYNYFEKICLPASQKCSHSWAFERIRGRKFGGPTLKKLMPAFRKEECLSSCLEQEDFDCQSAEYDQRVSQCQLNSNNRFSVNEKTFNGDFITKDGTYYFENNCLKEPRGFCNTKTYKKIYIGIPDKMIKLKKSNDCKIECFKTKEFNCRSYSYNSVTNQCYLNHHTFETTPKHAIKTDDNIETHEITTCYDVSVACEPHVMKVNVQTNVLFDGKIYVKNKPDTCYLDVSRTTNFSFPIMISGSECGTVEESEGKFSNIIVIQNNDLVLTSTDKAIGVHCTYELGNTTEFAILAIKHMNSSETSIGRASPPQLTMRILDLKGNDKTTVKLGEPLRIQVSVPPESAYGIFVRNMVAMDATGTSNLTLIDNKGCPAEAKMIREMRRIDGQNRALESVMEAFAFTGSNVLRIETDVETCLDSCNPVLCQLPSGRSDDQYMAVESLGKKRRKRRKRDALDGSTFKLQRTVAVHSDKFGVGITEEDAKNTEKNSIPESEDEYEYVQEIVAPNEDICLNSLMLTIGGCSFMLLQIILIVTCCATKYYKNQKMTAKKILNQHCSEFRNSLQDNLYGERQDTLWSDDKRHTLKSVP